LGVGEKAMLAIFHNQSWRQRWLALLWPSLVNRQAMAERPKSNAGEIVSAEIADWSRENPRRFWDPSRKLLRAIRNYQFWRSRSGIIPSVLCKWCILRHRFWSVVTGAEIPLNCNIGGGLLIHHPNGIVIAPEAKIGVNCLIFQQVTIASRGNGGAPVIAGHVDIGAGAKIFGPVHIGAHAEVAANSVVLRNVPTGAVAAGLPARNITWAKSHGRTYTNPHDD
jgi:serine O-acetyltransferase